jgi:CubicO group peptidase (beta-lactamase class C family)
VDVLAALGACLVAWGLYQLRVYLAVGAGYRAKVICSGLFVSRRPLDAVLLAQVSADSYWILRPFRIGVDRQARSVTASLLGWRPRTAYFRDGLGATLAFAAPRGPARRPSAPAPGARTPHRGIRPTAESSIAPARRPSESSSSHTPVASRPVHRLPPAPAVQRVVEDAFTEPDPRRLRRTYAVVVAHEGELVAEHYAPGFDASMPLPGWSMAKSVVNALIGILVGEGRLALDQRALLPEWPHTDPRAAISLEDLLRMRSGLRFSEAYANPWSDVLHMLYNCDDASGFAASRPLKASPGSVWSYASGTSNILSRIARIALGDDRYAAWPREALFGPLGMDSAVMEADAAGTFVGSSYMLATARDWARFGQLFADDGLVDGQALLPSGWVRFSTTPTPQSPGGRYGAHWWLKLNPEMGGDSAAARRLPADAFFAVGHEGQTLAVIPSRRLVAVRLGASIRVDAWNQATFVAALLDAL